MKKTLLIVGAIVVLLVLWGVFAYNGFVSKNEAINNQWAQVETQYQRRFDLIPNLVNAVKGVMKQEQTVFSDISQARTNYLNAKTVDEKAVAATQVEGSLAKLLVVMENYPQLKSADNVMALQTQLEGTENRISVERMRYNDLVKVMNQSVKSFPGNIFASLFGFGERQYFESAQGAQNAPQVNF